MPTNLKIVRAQYKMHTAISRANELKRIVLAPAVQLEVAVFTRTHLIQLVPSKIYWKSKILSFLYLLDFQIAR
jgi:hypothetical protein